MIKHRPRDHPYEKCFFKKAFFTVVVFLLITSILGMAALVNKGPELNKVRPVQRYVPFGGSIIKHFDFNDPSYFDYTPGVSYTADGIKVAPKNSYFSIENGCLTFLSESTYQGNVFDVFSVFGYETQTLLSDISYYMMDVDITLSDGYRYELRFNPDIRGDNYSLQIEGISQIKFYDGCIYSNSMLTSMALEDDSFHLTYIFDTNGVAYVYINGYYFGRFANIYQAGALYCDGLKITSYYDYTNNEVQELSIDNIVLTKFKKGYEGAISKIFEESPGSILDNSDTIFYQNEFGYEIDDLISY